MVSAESRGLYGIIDVDFVERGRLDVLAFAEAVLAARPPLIQLRAKRLGARDTLALLRALRQRCTPETLLFANDRPDLACLSGCDGVHVGQEDLGIRDVRRFRGSLLVGISTHDEPQLDRALAERPAYVAFGPVFPTSSKAEPDPVVGLEALARAGERCRAAGIPLVAIGGIDRLRAPEVSQHAAFGAVIGALGAPDAVGVAEQACALHRALGGR